ncbi:AraC family transcriptional regulator [Denitratisoma oestradiolicum]|uniref:Putative Ornithine utilization regulator n=1 Tax=Denitratisoma oestradiolicum TaxID=311182 RepID=A0A6S6Y9L7_9PROT|nr:AraC family transcriptional regulator [Denitratisoma oestradiolicum]TWO78726.1 hypothetical protein CBW56_18550 [Denitratisoma oestradiolicum]CAB1369272.1 putative Ornithine utilization regulator [Denitratisoma oestradiolicum]
MSDHLKSPSRLSFYLDCMRSRGFTAEQVLAGTGLDLNRLQDPSRRILPAQFRRTIQNMLDLTGDPYLGIAVGAEFKISNLGILGYAALSSATLKQSSEVFNKYGALNDMIVHAVGHIQGGRWFFEVRDSYLLGDLMRFAVEEFISRTMELSSSLTNRPFPVLELHVTYPAPADLTPYMRRFNCPLYFSQPKNIVVFDINRLQDPISLANEEVFKLCERQCQLLVSQKEDRDLLSNRIRNYLVKNPGKFPSLEDMAERLNMGSRTLRRWLVRENVTYQQILDDTRRELAIQYLQYTSLTPKEIGFILGYSSVSNFRRAFKSWTSKKLTDFRDNDNTENVEDEVEEE